MPIIHRPLCPGDRDELQQLHEDWFPVRYSSAFYESVVHGVALGTHRPLFSLVAVDTDERQTPPTAAAATAATSPEGALTDGSGFNGHASLDSAATPPPRQPTPHNNNNNTGRIVGAVVAQVTLVSSCQDIDLLEARDCTDGSATVLYILTLGTHRHYRRRGIAERLLRSCIAHGTAAPRCRAVYLHVITYNTAAIAFYQKNGFALLREIPDYYTIDQQRYNCYLYILHLARDQALPAPLAWVQRNIWRPVVSAVSAMLLRLAPWPATRSVLHDRHQQASSPGQEHHSEPVPPSLDVVI